MTDLLTYVARVFGGETHPHMRPEDLGHLLDDMKAAKRQTLKAEELGRFVLAQVSESVQAGLRRPTVQAQNPTKKEPS